MAEASPLVGPANALLAVLTGDPSATFRDDQLEAISALVVDRKKVLLVQRTGWGKSGVYFIATRLLRKQGAGPTLLISPLLALMNNQIQSAQRMAIWAETVNSTNRDQWAEVQRRVEKNQIDVLLVSPERLANEKFREEVLPNLVSRAGLFVVDEAHCISDWGHDFRPDYRRIRDVVDNMLNVPVLLCTATANERVVADIESQLGDDLVVFRGPLSRAGLRLSVVELGDQPTRLAWLTEMVEELPGTGIVYCLTVSDTEQVANWLVSCGIDAVPYHGGIDNDLRVQIESRLLANDVKVVVATSALGMGFDKPDVAFVIHYQSPGSPIAYYQQVGRAGRNLSKSYGILVHGSEDKQIQDYFIEEAFPAQDLTERVVKYLETAVDPCRMTDLLGVFNIRPSNLEKILKVLVVEGAVDKTPDGYQRSLKAWRYDAERAASVTAQRRLEQEQMLEYMDSYECRMQFLRALLDDQVVERCGQCDRCTGESFHRLPHRRGIHLASVFMKRSELLIEPRNQEWNRKGIPRELRMEQGRALSRWGDGGWGATVQGGKLRGRFEDELVEASYEMILDRWRPDPSPAWVTSIPSRRNPELVRDFAERLASKMGLPYVVALVLTRETRPQKTMQNSTMQSKNIQSAFAAEGLMPSGPVLLVDDAVDSRWTFTEAARVLRLAGCDKVFPFALASTLGRDA